MEMTIKLFGFHYTKATHLNLGQPILMGSMRCIITAIEVGVNEAGEDYYRIRYRHPRGSEADFTCPPGTKFAVLYPAIFAKDFDSVLRAHA